MSIFLRFLNILILPVVLLGQPSDPAAAESSVGEPLPFLNADFFADSLSEAYTLEEDPMGAQRLLQVRNSTLTPSVSISSEILYSDNHAKVSETQLTTNKNNGEISDAITFNLSLNFNLGIGEYGLGDSVVLAPSFTFINSRSFLDPFHDYGERYSKNRSMNMDTLMLQLTLPFVLPNDFYINIQHTYVAPYYFIQQKDQLMYSNVPSISFDKNFQLSNGDSIRFSSGLSYSFTDSGSAEQSFNSSGLADLGIDFEFYKALTIASTGVDPSVGSPSNVGDNLANSISLSYTKLFGEKMSVSPSLNYTHNNFTKGTSKSRSSKNYSASFSFNYAVTEWLSFTGLSMYSKLNTSGTEDDDGMSYKDFTSGFSFTLQHSF
jgi:hypothetical protein